jgi:hypothetical protein
MSEVNSTPEPCEFVREIEATAREVRRKASADWSSPLSLAYYTCSLELRRIVSRHITRSQCSTCLAAETLNCAARNTDALPAETMVEGSR